MVYIFYQISQLLGLVAFIAQLWLVVRAWKTRILWGLGVLLLSPITAIIYAIKYWQRAKAPFLVYITTLVAGAALGLYVFKAWGGWEVVKSALRVHAGIKHQTLTEQDARRFMHSNLDFLEHAAVKEQDQKTIKVIRKLLNKTAAGMSDAEGRQLIREFLEHVDTFDLDERQRQELERLRKELEQTDAEATGHQEGGLPPKKRHARLLKKMVPPSEPVSARYRLVYIPIRVTEAGEYLGTSVKVIRNHGPEHQGKLIAASPNGLRFEKRVSAGTLSFEYAYEEITSLKVLRQEFY